MIENASGGQSKRGLDPKKLLRASYRYDEMRRRKLIAVALGCTMLLAAGIFLVSIDGVLWYDPTEAWTAHGESRAADHTDGGDIFTVNPTLRFPNEGRNEALQLDRSIGMRSVYSGLHQMERQQWLKDEEYRLLSTRQNASMILAADDDGRYYCRANETTEAGSDSTRQRKMVMETATDFVTGPGLRGAKAPVDWGEGQSGSAPADDEKCEKRLSHVRAGVQLWNRTYVPPIAPEEKRRLLDKWTAEHHDGRPGAQRILYVITSFDRGRRLGRGYHGDKLDYILMMLDEVREACEAGFSLHVHLIAAWNIRSESEVVGERLFCRRTGEAVPHSFEHRLPKLKELLSIKHRLYMKSRVNDYDLFIQAEDDMILTVNHILLYLQELEKLSYRRGNKKSPNYRFAPGFIRIEPEAGRDEELPGIDGEWYEWEVILSRIQGTRIKDQGVYLTLGNSKILKYGGNNQGFWIATQGQMKHLQSSCGYLGYTDKTIFRYVEWFSGSLEMFSPQCGIKKVFPADRFEEFLVHHRANNKNGNRGETIPAVPVSLLRLWASQILRDGFMMRAIDD